MKRKQHFCVFAVCLLSASILGTSAQAAQSAAMTRGEWITSLYSSYTATAQTSDSTSTVGTATAGFSDVESGSSVDQAVCWARAQGISKGYDGQHFQPDSPITRLQAAVMLYRYEQADSEDISAADPQSESSPGWSAIPAWGRPAAIWAVSRGVWFSGSGALNPSEPLDTAEGNTMIYAAFHGGMQISSVTISPDADVEFSLSSVTAAAAAATLSNRGTSVLTYGCDYFLQQKFYDTWYWRQVNGVFTMELYELQPAAGISLQLNWENFCGVLPAGKYRIVKYVTVQSLPDGAVTRCPVAAEFTVD